MNKKCPLCDEPAVISHELTTTNVEIIEALNEWQKARGEE